MVKPVPGFIKDRLRTHLSLSVIPRLLRYADLNLIDLVDLAYRRIGIGNYESPECTGEKWLVTHALPLLLKGPGVTVFDVGANTGQYSEALHAALPDADIHAFEPLPSAFEQLRRVGCHVKCHRIGLSDAVAQRAPIYDYDERAGSEHASLYKSVLVDLHKSESPIHFEVELTTVDDFCRDSSFSKIDFLKIDTEGNELNVLKGARRMLERGSIRLIQFEFNEMNVVSRVFLRDFYEILCGFDLYRLLPNSLLPLGDYWSRYEVFAYQNIFAILRGAFDDKLTDSLTVARG